MSKIFVGKITGCHGIKGELKVLSNFEFAHRVFTKDFSLYINDAKYTITSIRLHKNFYLITINDLYDINKVTNLIGYDIYIEKDDLRLQANEYLLEDLIGAKVYDKDEYLGVITDVLLGKNNNYIKVNNSFLIPLIDIYIDYFAKENNTLYTKNGKDLKL